MPINGLLLVEGTDDSHVFANLFREHSIPRVFEIRSSDGIDPLLDSLPVHFKGSEVSRLGIVVDADTDVHRRWQQLQGILTKSNFPNVPDTLAEDGLIIDGPNELRVGLWIMPDNNLPGQLEDFVNLMVPADNDLWAHAQSCVEAIPVADRLFRDGDLVKALIHTWLAWQATPGVPMGSAINRKYLQFDGPEARQFVNWIRRLFL